MAGFDSHENFQVSHRDWVKSSLSSDLCRRDSMWTESIAIGTNEFVSKIYAEFGPLAKGRKIIPREKCVSFQIREEIEPYNPLFDGKKYDIGNKNTHSWDNITDFSGC